MKMNKQIKWNINELDSENVEEYLIKLRGIWPQEFNFNEEIALNFIHEMKYKLPWEKIGLDEKFFQLAKK